MRRREYLSFDDLVKGQMYLVRWGGSKVTTEELLEFVGLAGRGRGVMDTVWRSPAPPNCASDVLTEIPSLAIRSLRRLEE